MQKIYSASQVFTGQEWLRDHAVIIGDGVIRDVVPRGKELTTTENFEHCLLVPAFIDVQVYGAAGKLLALYPGYETLQTMWEEFVKEGTVLFLPTVATNTLELFKKSIDAVKEYWSKGGKGVPGIHLEGPWINEEKKGAHIKEWIHPPTVDEVRDLLEYGRGAIKMITLAPEVCSEEVIGLIHSYEVLVSAGHSGIRYHHAMQSFDQGISAVTHLYNAMSPLHHREPGLVGAAFNHRKIMASIIPDGHHVDYAAVRIAKELMGPRLFAITDAVTETNAGPYQHHLVGDKYECNGILSGSALSMHRAFKNLVQQVGLDPAEALRMCSLYPARVLLSDDRYGKIAPGYSANLVVLNQDLEIVKVII